MLSLPHPPYSPDLVPADFFLFPKIKMQLKGRRFHTVVEIQCESQTTTHTWSQKHQYTTPDVNTTMSRSTLPSQDWRSLKLRAQSCAAICWRATELIRKLFGTPLYKLTRLFETLCSCYKHGDAKLDVELAKQSHSYCHLLSTNIAWPHDVFLLNHITKWRVHSSSVVCHTIAYVSDALYIYGVRGVNSYIIQLEAGRGITLNS
jgi:hypothetical protein